FMLNHQIQYFKEHSFKPHHSLLQGVIYDYKQRKTVFNFHPTNLRIKLISYKRVRIFLIEKAQIMN
ncbi:MAG: hypothetical protein WCH34_05745, partial [Bacteroidota bacterium]